MKENIDKKHKFIIKKNSFEESFSLKELLSDRDLQKLREAVNE